MVMLELTSQICRHRVVNLANIFVHGEHPASVTKVKHTMCFANICFVIWDDIKNSYKSKRCTLVDLILIKLACMTLCVGIVG